MSAKILFALTSEYVNAFQNLSKHEDSIYSYIFVLLETNNRIPKFESSKAVIKISLSYMDICWKDQYISMLFK